MTENIQDLLKPRYKVIADYPNNPWLVGEHLIVDDKGELVGKITGYVDYMYQIMEKDSSKYPHLFQKLEWWQDRKPEEMPEYVKDADNDTIMYKVHGWLEGNAAFQFAKHETCITPTKYFLPITEAEYLSFNKQPQI